VNIKSGVYAILMVLGVRSVSGQTPCAIGNTAFNSGEEFHYKVIYNWGAIWIESAECRFAVSPTLVKGRVCYLLSGSGFTYPKYSWIYKVKDDFEGFVDSSTFRPLRFKAEIHEGGKHEKHDYFFNNLTRKVFTSIQRGKEGIKVDSLNIGSCTVDVLTAIYFARNLDYSKCKVNDTISMSLLLDNKLYPIYIRYLGKAVYDGKELGKFNCIKFSPLLVEGTIFRGGEGMTVWVSDDRNKMPLYVETPIIVGTIKVRLMDFKGLRNPMDSKIK
jgi:hypothetical protein